MSGVPEWWDRPRTVAVVTDETGWMVSHCRELVRRLCAAGDDASLHHDPASPGTVDVAFYLGCREVTPPEILAQAHRNLVVHASDLPAGRGWSPLTWQILEGRNDIPVCLFDAVEDVDAGPVVYREQLTFNGHELIDEMRQALGQLSVELCERFLAEVAPPAGEPQAGELSWYPRRRPADSALDPERSLAEQFDLLRVCDNEAYPAFFDWRGHRYHLRIERADTDPEGGSR